MKCQNLFSRKNKKIDVSLSSAEFALSMVLKVGVTETRYVSLKFCRPWVIHAFKNLKGRGVHKANEDPASPMEKEETIPKRRKLDQDASTLSGSIQQSDSLPTVSNEQPVLETATSVTEHVSSSATETDEKAFDTNTAGLESCTLPPQDRDSVEIRHSENGHKNNAELISVDSGLEKSSPETKHSVTGSSEGKINSEIVGPPDMEVDLDTESTVDTTVKTVDPEMEQESSIEKPSTSMHTRSERKRKHPYDPLELSKKDEPQAVSSYDKVRVLCQPWKKPEGLINRPALKMMLESVMLFLMLKPACDIRELYNRYSPYIQPGVLNNLVEILEEIGCLTRQYIKPSKPSLFSKPFQCSLAEEESEDSHVFLVPTLECMYVLGQFGQEMYPGESWPRAEELTSKN